MQGLLG